jgi:hypothetical protein
MTVVIGCTASFRASEQERMPAGPLQVEITFARVPGLERRIVISWALLLQVSDYSFIKLYKTNHSTMINSLFLDIKFYVISDPSNQAAIVHGDDVTPKCDTYQGFKAILHHLAPSNWS